MTSTQQKGTTTMTVIRAAHYAENEALLQNDPIVLAMANEIASDPNRGKVINGFTHDDGSARFEFMQMANGEYRRRGGTANEHIGAVAAAILALLGATP
ncbi:hypothetical protein PBI_EQUEMIOH13_87 [Mycobacterium phage Equemioh13]|uniref:Uncharacterized protein n=1 Tax=Mycobacterium phage Centaur TaxID=2488784 RepID=A0A3G8FF85_9CAUD|nr:hypothetical protein AVT12_gp19 [Mycobacterium phage Equemioh13]YP_010063702.1 hypothetical protein KIY82_gp20 [Mycobacterium phage Centaur]AMB18578.1 hypothetical protein NASIATALIE_88 [Mycobacterium phage NaSiaTalie]AOZ64030.1 hypothetical protein SEA_BAEHEXIC_86 [Mycobacterium phage Baehexic]AYD86362.1 hypothetical protein SEA_FLARE16_87 [Mycobacterium phage Flare16]QDM57289.1 hypothetical protein SEA_WIDEWALE_88 [Mycobacterium phage WideWale]QXN74116.1 hypothetical protein SEA_MICULUCI